jgi:hypothetical protein
MEIIENEKIGTKFVHSATKLQIPTTKFGSMLGTLA